MKINMTKNLEELIQIDTPKQEAKRSNQLHTSHISAFRKYKRHIKRRVKIRVSRNKSYISKSKNHVVRKKMSKEQRSRKLHEKRLELKLWAINERGGFCADCGHHYHPAAMEFHHYLATKNKDVSYFIKNGNKARLAKELKICELLCSNYHKIRHFHSFRRSIDLPPMKHIEPKDNE